MRSAMVLFFAAVCGSARLGTFGASDVRRPFYIIAHMANSIKTMDQFLDYGANGVEVDVTFKTDGAAWRLYHGVPCDMFRICHEKTDFVDYLQAAAKRSLALLFLDLKSSKLNDKAMELAGVDVARKLMGHFWNKGASNVSVIVSVPSLEQRVLLKSFRDELRAKHPSKLTEVSYEVSMERDFDKVAKMFRELEINAAWLGDGITNWFEPLRSLKRMRQAIDIRDRGDLVFKKVYRWTVDWKGRIRQLMNMGADAVMTNKPARGAQALQEIKELRLAEPADPVNAWYHL